ncbi:MAG: phosphotransacetylase [Methanocalculus sp. MSAO_Arc1]|uniref:methanogenesis marker protein Mmp4/MtxX n=1 Tax=Methanocalculus TaxID=71151 RepID=UPI000FEF6FCA|nr:MULTISPECIES: methanogenesis marker protein Mmp4/MtxX [unclassified Methanocalculus]MCP1663217.1 putative methanogen marker protein 4 [Methanocalculus sp. AMF5]RQD80699.1 MAG: phosphotransacetylase [Methanocalculus sp. MSAO_Arc1]
MVTIGIGASGDPQNVLWAAKKAAAQGIGIVIYTTEEIPDPEISGISMHVSKTPETTMIDALVKNEIDGAVRGTLPANSTLRHLREQTGAGHLERIAVLETAGGDRFLLAPVGIDEGWTVGSKLDLIQKAKALARQLGIDQSVGILSGGRLGDVGRNPVVDRSLADAELLARICCEEHKEILIEEVVGSHGIVIAPDGISGNLIFRTLVLLGSGKSYGAPVVNIGVTFVDTSRASPWLENAISLAAALRTPR